VTQVRARDADVWSKLAPVKLSRLHLFVAFAFTAMAVPVSWPL
jgi:hypothetical protein